MAEPTHGTTKSGKAVHGRTHDHLPDHNAYARFNKKAAIWITEKVGTMTTTWIFCVLALVSLPAILNETGWLGHPFPSWMISVSLIALVAWVAQTFIQLVLLPAIMVGQAVQSEASDARAAKTFEDVAEVLDKVNENTDGGIKVIIDLLNERLPAKKAPARKR